MQAAFFSTLCKLLNKGKTKDVITNQIWQIIKIQLQMISRKTPAKFEGFEVYPLQEGACILA